MVQVGDSEFELHFAQCRTSGASAPSHAVTVVDVTGNSHARHHRTMLQQIFEQSRSPYMVCADDGKILHTNARLQQLLHAHVASVRSAAPGFDPQRIHETSANVFTPGKQLFTYFINLTGPTTIPVELGNARFELFVNPLTYGEERRFLVEWRDRTSQSRYASEVSRVLEALEAGDLEARGQVEGLQADHERMLENVNHLIETITDPLRHTLDAVRRLAVGDLPDLIDAKYEGAFGELRDSVNALIKTTDQIATVASHMADGDFTTQFEQRSDADELVGSLSRMVRELSALMRQAQDASEQLDMGSNQVQEASQTLADNASRSAGNLQEISSTMIAFSAQTSENAQNATSALNLSRKARESADLGDEQMRSMVGSMTVTSPSRPANISKIIKVIDDIAFQTNLLALNAAVEAGRAGRARARASQWWPRRSGAWPHAALRPPRRPRTLIEGLLAAGEPRPRDRGGHGPIPVGDRVERG